jgi:uncharacterized protein
MKVVSDSSPLIALSRIGRLDLLQRIFGDLVVPDAVWREVAEDFSARPGAEDIRRAMWIRRGAVRDADLVQLLRQDLGAGEAETLVLARELTADLVLMDELKGRRAALRLGLKVTGLAGILIEAGKAGHVADLAALLSDLHLRAGFWLSDQLRSLILVEGRQAR